MQITEEGWKERWSLIDVGIERPLYFFRSILIQRSNRLGKLREPKCTIWFHSRELHFEPSKITVRIRLPPKVKGLEKNKSIFETREMPLKWVLGSATPKHPAIIHRARGSACLFDKQELWIVSPSVCKTREGIMLACLIVVRIKYNNNNNNRWLYSENKDTFCKWKGLKFWYNKLESDTSTGRSSWLFYRWGKPGWGWEIKWLFPKSPSRLIF